MAKYTLSVESGSTLPGNLSAFHGKTFARRDIAFLWLRKAIYELMRANSLLDRPIAKHAMDWAHSKQRPCYGYLTKPGQFIRDENLGVLITLSKDA